MGSPPKTPSIRIELRYENGWIYAEGEPDLMTATHGGFVLISDLEGVVKYIHKEMQKVNANSYIIRSGLIGHVFQKEHGYILTTTGRFLEYSEKIRTWTDMKDEKELIEVLKIFADPEKLAKKIKEKNRTIVMVKKGWAIVETTEYSTMAVFSDNSLSIHEWFPCKESESGFFSPMPYIADLEGFLGKSQRRNDDG